MKEDYHLIFVSFHSNLATFTAQVSHIGTWCNTGIKQISPFHFTSTWTASAFSVNLGFFRKSPRSRASSFSWQTLVSKCQTDFFDSFSLASQWKLMDLTAFSMVSPRSNVQRPSRFLWGFPSCRRKQSWPIGCIWIQGLDPCKHLGNAAIRYGNGAHLPHLLYQVSSPCHGAQFCPENQIPIDMAPGIPMAQKTRVDSPSFHPSFEDPYWSGIPRQASPETNETNQKADGRWFGIIECGRCKHQPSTIINQYQPMLTWCRSFILIMETSGKELVPLAISKKT